MDKVDELTCLQFHFALLENSGKNNGSTEQPIRRENQCREPVATKH